MTADERDLPVMIAPPLAPDASFDADVAAAFGTAWLGGPRDQAAEPPRRAA